jgi:hypothetical protein
MCSSEIDRLVQTIFNGFCFAILLYISEMIQKSSFYSNRKYFCGEFERIICMHMQRNKKGNSLYLYNITTCPNVYRQILHD